MDASQSGTKVGGNAKFWIAMAVVVIGGFIVGTLILNKTKPKLAKVDIPEPAPIA